MNYKDMSQNPAYKFAKMDHITYMRTQVVSEWSVVQGWTLHTCVFDTMHNLYLGSGRDYMACAVRVLVEKGCFDSYGVPRDSDDMFARITMEVHEDFQKHKLL